MNKRIQELMEQAEDPEHGFIIPEKFAELIIGECIASLDSDDGATHHSELLLEHFGLLKAGENMSDKGYSIGTKEGYDAFVEKRNAGNRSETLE
jgi:hypothetical protein